MQPPAMGYLDRPLVVLRLTFHLRPAIPPFRRRLIGRSLAFMLKLPAMLVAVVVATTGCGSTRTSTTIEWQGHAFEEVATLDRLPAAIQSVLGANQPGLDGVADRGEPFNATDVVNPTLPMRRFLTAGSDGQVWLVAVERGGRSYSVEVLLFSEGASPKATWVLLHRPRTLREVVRQVSQQDSHEG